MVAIPDAHVGLEVTWWIYWEAVIFVLAAHFGTLGMGQGGPVLGLRTVAQCGLE